MPSYTIHVPRDGDDAIDRADRTTLVRDGFSVSAFLLGPLYLLRHRAWSAAALWVVVVAGGAFLCQWLRLPLLTEAGLLLLVALFTGLEANSIRRLNLHRRGFDMADVVAGVTREEGERAFFTGATASGLPPRVTVLGPGRRSGQNEPVIGSLSDPWPP